MFKSLKLEKKITPSENFLKFNPNDIPIIAKDVEPELEFINPTQRRKESVYKKLFSNLVSLTLTLLNNVSGKEAKRFNRIHHSNRSNNNDI